MKKPLKDIKVLELTHVIAAPFCGMLLGDLGADIIKIERPGEGEYGRIAGPKMSNGTSLWFPAYNRNKKGMTLDLKKEEAKKIFIEIIKNTDVLIENFRPGLLSKMGLGYENLKEINPKLIMVSLSGFGQDGPYSSKTAFDMTVLAVGGLMALSGEPNGLPVKMGTAVSDFLAGLYGVIGTLAALKHRDMTGKGQYVDVSMLDGVLSILETSLAEYDLLGREPGRPGNRRVFTAPSNVFKASDGYIYIAAFFQSHWCKICSLMDKKEWLEDERFINGESRKKHEDIIEKNISDWVKDKTVKEVSAILENEDIPCAPVNKIKDIMEDEHIRSRNTIVSFDYPGTGEFKTCRFPVRFSDIDIDIEKRPPLLGEHNKEIVCDYLGYTKDEYEKLLEKGVF